MTGVSAAPSTPDPLAGRRLLHYTLLHRVGAGGMGEVYKARDEKLDRTVAVKILPEAFSGSRERIQRFEREARIASSLSHPAIAAVYEVGEADGVHFIAMEYVEGEPLSAWMASRPRLPDVLRVMEQVADALARAHQAGVLHRDLKPANVLVAKNGRAKLLDFGLAKIAGETDSSPDASTQEQLTDTGIVLGTLAYMSPEQAKGHPTDRRSDVFSFGILLYEAATGAHPFPATAGLEAAAAVLRDDPIPVLRELRGTPAELVRILAKALEKDPARRYQFMDDLVVDLRALRHSLESGAWESQALRARKALGWLWVGGGILAGFAMTGVALLLTAASGGSREPDQLPVARPGATVRRLTSGGLNQDPWISSRGDRVAYASAQSGSFDVFIQDLATGRAVRVTDDPGDEIEPAISPDGQSIAYATYDGRIQTVPALGGAVRTLVTGGAGADGPVWSPDGQRLAFRSRRSLYLVGRTGGDPVLVPGTEDLPAIMRAAWLPEGRLVFPSFDRGKYVLVSVSPSQGGAQVVGRDLQVLGTPSWSGDGAWIVGSMGPPRTTSTEIWAVPWGPGGVGAPQRLLGGVLLHRNPTPSADGRRLAVEVVRQKRVLMRSPLPGSETGAPSVVAEAPASAPSVSPDGSSVVVVTEQGGRQRLVKLSLRDGRLEVLREGAGADEHPAWSPDGSRIAFAHVGDGVGGGRRIALIAATGGDLTFLSEPEFAAMYPAWSPDGRSVAFVARAVGSSIRVVPAAGGPSRELWAGPANLGRLSWSPDGRWIAAGARSRDGAHSVGVIPSSGGEMTTLIADARSPTWLPGGGIAFLRGSAAGTLDLWTSRVGTDGHVDPATETPVTRLPRSQYVEDSGTSTDGRFIYFSVWERTASDIWLVEAPP